MTRFFKTLLVTCCILSFFSCEKEVSPDDLQVHYEGNVPLKGLFLQGDNWIACGGEIFDRGVVIKGDLDTKEIVVDSIYNKCQNNLISTPDLYSTGTYSIGKQQDGVWKIRATPDLFILNDMIKFDDHIFAVGGAGLSIGVLYTYDEDLNLLDVLNFDHDLSFIKQIEDRVFVGGFGLLMYSDNMENWTIIDEYEDHFIDMEFSERTGIVVLGASGRILSSKNNGQTWDELKTPTLSGVSNFKDLLITDEKMIVACGKNICVSDKNESKWESIKLDVEGEINRLAGNNERIFFVTDSGRTLSIAH